MALGRQEAEPESREPLIDADGKSILVLNVGSSTLKFGLFPLAARDEPLLSGALEYSPQAVRQLLQTLEDDSRFASVQAIGHRIVHGGTTMRKPTRVDARVRRELDGLIPLAPDHLPTELRAIDEVAQLHPTLIQVACFDTAFHGDLPAVARRLALSRELTESGVVRYGFHGLSYEYITTTLRERGELPPRTIIAHLGNGASVAAIRDGISIDTSMGMTPAGGLVMSTRSGDLDPGVLLYLSRARGFSLAQLDEAVNHRGGLLGISQLSGDVRDLLAASGGDQKAREAIDIFCYQIRKFIGAYAAALGGLDLLVFTGGIGEHSHTIRGKICEGLAFLGINIDPARNAAGETLISTATGAVAVRTMKTQEEAMIARHVRELLAGGL
ncbi:MAG TPA: acetate/propionate family kinase [Gemmatimonadaceae bacterium]